MAKNGIDFTQFEEYRKKFTQFHYEFDEWLRRFIIEMAERVVAKTKERTPVDTGALRESWQIGKVQGDGVNLSIEILNGMEYASYVEWGRAARNGGWVDGRYMLTLSMNEIIKQMPYRFERDFANFCKQLGIA